ACVQTGRDDLPLQLTHQQVVLRLQGDGYLEATGTGRRHRLLHLPAGEVRQPDIADLPRADHVVERAERLVESGERVPGVHLVEVKAVDPEAAQRVVQGALQVTA